jgi:hypothetical protein
MSIERVLRAVLLLLLPVTGLLVALSPPAAARDATVSLVAPDLSRGQKAELTVNLTVANKPISLRRLYVKVRCREMLELAHTLQEEKDGKGKVVYPSKQINVKREETVFEKEFTIVAGQDLAAGSHHTFKGEVELPSSLAPSFKGKFSQIKWEAAAFTDIPGWFDPASSWQEVMVK